VVDHDRSVAVTGIGVQTSIGCTRSSFWENLVAGKSGVRPIRAFDAALQKSRIASEVADFDPLVVLNSKQARRMARVSQLAVCAASEAVKDAGLDLGREAPARVGCIIGSAAGDYNTLEEQLFRFEKKGPGSVNALTVPKVIPNMPAANVALTLGITGPNFGVSSACATGGHAIGLARAIILQGLVDVVLAGGTESTITPFVLDGYSSMGVLSQRNGDCESASRPFDADRDGFVMGEGAGVLVLESMEHAKKRDAEILALVRGLGMTCDAYSVAIPEPTGKTAAGAIELALRDAALNVEDIGFINAHGTSTKANDRIETNAVRHAFGSRAQTVPVSSNKSMIGHTLGAAGAIEAAATVLTLLHGIIPPNINYQTPDPECDLNIIGNHAVEAEVKAAISNSFGFGGQNAVLVFTRFP
jgi:3-oxoacyl-[acyl-carrier-protein] synthase II